MEKQNGNALLALSVICAMTLAGCGGGRGGSGAASDATSVSQDSTPPAVTLTGEKSITIEQFATSYKELGATANDETDGNVSVNISGEAGDEPNVYTITYDAYDNSGNRGTAERYVTVIAPPEDTNRTKIDVLAVYSNGADALYEGDAETRIIQTIAETNAIYNASRTGVKFVLVHMEKLSWMSDTETMSETIDKIQADEQVGNIRNTVRADEVVGYRLLTSDPADGGRGYLNNDLLPEYAISVVGIEREAGVVAHEIGHNMGNSHSHKQSYEGFAGKFPYSTGHVIEGDFGTIMSYAYLYNAEWKLVLSNPDLECNGQPCGIEAGEVGEADTSRAIREVKTVISEFR